MKDPYNTSLIEAIGFAYESAEALASASVSDVLGILCEYFGPDTAVSWMITIATDKMRREYNDQ